MKPFLIIAHRGNSQRYPENTLPAFEAAVDDGADMIELDVTLTVDGHFVVIHDDTLPRTTDGDGFVCHKTQAEIARLDAGRWFGRDQNDVRVPGISAALDGLGNHVPKEARRLLGKPVGGARKAVRRKIQAGRELLREHGEVIRVPSMTEVLDAVGGRIGLNIEVKPFFPLHQAGRMQAALSRMITQIEERKLTDSVIISSINVYLLDAVRELNQDLRLALIYRRPLTDVEPHYVREVFGIYSLHPWEVQTDRALIEQMHALGAKVFPYTVNDPHRLRELRDLGADGAFCDDPVAAREALSASN